MLIEPLCHGRRCVVVGSAPGVTVPAERSGEVVLGANGGAALANRPAHVLVATAHLFRQAASAPEEATKSMLRGLQVESLWLDERNGTLAEIQPELQQLGIEYGRARGVSPAERDQVVHAVTGKARWVSTGVWATCLAVLSRASQVHLCGVSLRGGHEGLRWDKAPRFHVCEDAACLRALRSKRVWMGRDLLEAIE